MRPLPALAALLAALLLAPAAARAQASASPYTSAIRYDAVGRVTGTISASPNSANGLPFIAVRSTYDPAGRLIKVETGALAAWQSEGVAPANWTGFTVHRTLETVHDAMGRKIRDSLREGAAGTIQTVTQYSYDALGRLECEARRMNPAAFAAPPASACTLGSEGTHGPDRITRTIYDAAGQRLQLREGVGTGAEAAETTWDYNANGQVRTIIDANGNRAELRYDGHGRQDRWTFPSATPLPAAGPGAYNDATQATALASAGSVNAGDYEEYGYDAAGNRTSLRKRDGSTLTYQYDALNRMIVKIVPERAGLAAMHTRDVHYGYDLRNLQTYARFDSASGEGVTNAYDGFGRLASSSVNMGGVTRTLAYQHDAAGNRIRITHPDGQWFDQSHDALGRPVFLSSPAAGGIVFVNYTAHGAPGNVSRGNQEASYFSYDGVQRLSAVMDDHGGAASDVTFYYGRNPAGQLGSLTRTNDAYAWTGHYAVNRAYAANGLNQYSAAGGASFLYDLNGNLTSDGSRTYGYDIENRLVAAWGAASAALRYDPLGRLYEVAGGSGTTRFLYDGDALVAEYDGAGALLRRHVHSVGADVPMVTYEGANLLSPRYLFADHQGSIVALSDAAGAVTALNAYDEYGIPGAANQGRFQYTGQAWLPELGMYHYKARIYSPTLGRFLQTDPIGYDDDVNLYAYVGNDPVNHTDPDGTQMAADPLVNAVEQVAGYVAWVASDLGDLAVGIGQGRLAWAFGGMPPTLSGGAGGVVSGLGRTALRAEASVAGQAVGRAAQSRRATTPYSRPSGATTPAQRASVQGRPCVHCGRVSTPQRAGHKTALVREHYETGSIDRTRMRSTDAIQPECIKCSAQEGAEMSRYSREMRRQLDDRH